MNKWQKVKIGGYLIKESMRLVNNDVKNLEVYGVSNVAGITKTSHKQSEDLSNYILIKPDFFAYNPYRINVGSIGLTPEGVNGLVSPAYVVFRTDKNRLLPELLLSFLKSSDGLFEIKRHARGTVRQALRFEDLCRIEMSLPPIEQQRKIVNKKIKIQKYHDSLYFQFFDQENIIQNLRKSILHEVIEKAKNNITLDKLCDFIKGESPIQKTQPGKYLLVTTSDERKTSDKYQFNTKAVCVPIISSAGHGKKTLNYVHYQEGKFALGNILVALISKDDKILNPKFLHLYLSINKDDILVRLMRGMANVTLPIGEMKKIILPLPSIEEQNKVAMLINKLDKLAIEVRENKKIVSHLMQSVSEEAFNG